jgi:anti-sigma regulatory factor (Ser/Thr protein kinase)
VQSVDQSLSQTYPAEPLSVGKARAFVGDFAAVAGATRRQVDDVRLATSEAVTNSVLHAYRGRPGSIYVTAVSAADEFWILIADDGCGLEPRSDRSGLGLGLGLISQVTDGLAIAARASGGTEVRMSFKLASSMGELHGTAAGRGLIQRFDRAGLPDGVGAAEQRLCPAPDGR